MICKHFIFFGFEFKNINLENIPRTIEINPELLSTSDKTMSENYKLLKILMSEKDLANLYNIK